MLGKRFFLFVLAVESLFAAFFTPATAAQRLPGGVKPLHYSLSLAPDIRQRNFTGTETIDVLLDHPANAITLNAAEIQFGKVTATAGGKTLRATVSTDAEKEQATFSFPQDLPAGSAVLAIEYTGVLNGELRGFYLSKTAKRDYAVTQFEPTDARRAFPSFDEPAYKATFDISLTVDKGDTAISNTNIISDMPGPSAEKHTLKFATTPKMSTYLVAFLVGDFQCVSGESERVPIRACATPDKVQMGKFAVTSAEYLLHYYNRYFGIKYPMPKLDMVAIPDFEAGAMENFGAITYRETDLLIDEKTASLNAKKRVAIVVAHEMAHQWFGDMVTMQWWDNVWLNEGFASWMENKAVASWKPEWRLPEDVAEDLDRTLNFDSQRQTRTIRAQADTPGQINEMFDGISYGKGGAVLLMVENYLGDETFRKGVHEYLSAHMYGNATAEDFWNTQTAISHKPVDKIMSGLVAQPGVPILTFSSPESGHVEVSQQRFFLSVKPPVVQSQIWTVPVCFKGVHSEQICDVLRESNQTLNIPKSPVFFANAQGKGYYRYSYPAEISKELFAKVETGLTPEERINLVGNQWALTRTGRMEIGSYLDLIAALKGHQSPAVFYEVIGSLSSIRARIAATSEEREQLSAWIRKSYAPSLASVGSPAPGESPEKTELRASLFSLVGGLGEDSATIAQAKELTKKSLADPTSVEPTLATSAVTVAAESNDPHLYELLLKASQTSTTPELASRALYSLTDFTDPDLVKRTLDYAVSGKVRNQDALHLVNLFLHHVDTQDIAWQFVQQNWDKVKAQMTPWMGAALIEATSSFCSADMRDQVVNFFGDHKVPAAERALSRLQYQINDCIDLRAAQEPKLQDWLKANN
jgi:aminopeptidase N